MPSSPFSRKTTHAKFALPAGGTPYFQRTSSFNRSCPQSLMLNRRVREDEVSLHVRMQINGIAEPEADFVSYLGEGGLAAGGLICASIVR
jgi:hypothetical protein